MFKKTTKFFVGIALLVQSVTALIMFLATLGKKKGLSGALLALSAISGIAGGWLVYDSSEDDDSCVCDDCGCEGDCDNCECEEDCDNCPCDCQYDELDIDEKGLFSRDDEAEAE